MPRRNSTPDQRAADAKRRVSRVRRNYKVDMKKRRKLLPGEQEHVADMIVVLKLASYSNTQIGKVIGISRGQVKEILAEPATSEKLVLLRSKLPAAALDLLQGYMIEAVQAIVDVMRVSDDDSVVLKAAGEILDRAGIPKASRQERHQVNEERTVITDDGIVDRLRAASPEVQEEAALVIERLELLLAAADADAATTDEEGGDE